MGNLRHLRYGTRRSVYFSGNDAEGSGQLSNISLGGCAVESAASVKVGASLQLEVNISDQEAPLFVALATVRWSHAGRFWTEFIGIDPAPRLRLHRFVNALKTGGRRRSPTPT